MQWLGNKSYATNTHTGGKLGGANPYGSAARAKTAAPMRPAVAKPKPPGQGLHPPTPASAGRPRSGYFQYGHNQWGFLNGAGNVTWTAKQPKPGASVLNWNNVQKYLQSANLLSGMPTAAAHPGASNPSWLANDPTYQRDLSELIAGRDTNIQSLERQESQYKDAYNQGLAQLATAFNKSKQQMMGSLGARGLSGSGIEGREFTNLTNDRAQQEAGLGLETGPARWQMLEEDAQKERELFEQRSLNLKNEAKAYYEATHGKEPPKDFEKGFRKKGSTWFYTNGAGITVSLGTKTPPGMRQPAKSGGAKAPTRPAPAPSKLGKKPGKGIK